MTSKDQWIVCQIGAREHYAIPRALHQAGRLAALVTDLWCPPDSLLAKFPSGKRLRDRWHPDLATANVLAPSLQMLGFEGYAKIRQMIGWERNIARNHFFQHQAIRLMRASNQQFSSVSVLFSYSYAALKIFKFGRTKGWTTVLGQIDPGPEEERIVAAEHLRYPHLKSRWQPAPSDYWNDWKQEIEFSDRVVINSEWSRECLVKEGISVDKLDEIPLVYERADTPAETALLPSSLRSRESLNIGSPRRNLRVLFLGQINLRKGVGRLLDAMRLIKDEPIQLTLAGPTEIDPSAWEDLPNVSWIGPIPRREVGKVYQSSDVFILPTLSDGYALTQLEALAYGLPLLRSTRCGNPLANNYSDLLLNSLEPASIACVLVRSARMSTIEGWQTNAMRFTLFDLAQRLIGSAQNS